MYDKLSKTYKINRDLPYWETIPIDLTSKKNLIENKNYTNTLGGDGVVTIKEDDYMIIQRLKDRGLTPKQIEEIYKREGKTMPTVPITASKLTGINKIGMGTEQYIVYDRDVTTGKIYAKGMKLKDKDDILLFDKAKGYQSKPQLTYDMLTTNARVFYSPLSDTNAKLANGHVTLPYKKDKDNKNYLVPYTRITITRPRGIMDIPIETKEIEGYVNASSEDKIKYINEEIEGYKNEFGSGAINDMIKRLEVIGKPVVKEKNQLTNLKRSSNYNIIQVNDIIKNIKDNAINKIMETQKENNNENVKRFLSSIEELGATHKHKRGFRRPSPEEQEDILTNIFEK